MRRQRTITHIQVDDQYRDQKKPSEDKLHHRGPAPTAARAIEMVRRKCKYMARIVVSFDNEWVDENGNVLDSETRSKELTFTPQQYAREPGKMKPMDPWYGLIEFERKCLESQQFEEMPDDVVDVLADDSQRQQSCEWEGYGWHALKKYAKEQGIDTYRKSRNDLQNELRAKLSNAGV